MVTEKGLIREFKSYRNEALDLLAKGHIDRALSAVKLACVLAKTYYLCYEDDVLESIVSKATEAIFTECSVKEENSNSNQERYIFYDTHATDNVALTQQYLSALISWGVPFLYITTKSLGSRSTRLIKTMIDNCPLAEIHEVPQGLGIVESARRIHEVVVDYGASKALIQTTSDDVSGVMAWSAPDEVETFYIDLSDHGFWLGAKAFDYVITFRSNGYNICTQQRGISADKVFVQPFYPVSVSKAFRGMDVNNEDSIKVLSGGRLEKIYGKSDAYFNMIEKVMEQNPEVELYFAGGGAFGKLGQTSYIEKQFSSRNLQDRIHMLGFRDDIVEVMKHMDLYIGTYPIGGGLMTQIAASQGLPIVQYATEGLSDHVDEFLMTKESRTFLYKNDMEGFLARVRELVTDTNERHRIAEINRQSTLAREDFDKRLHAIVLEGSKFYTAESYRVSLSALRSNQIDVENNCYPSHDRILVRSAYIRRSHPVRFAISVIRFVGKADKKWLARKLINE